ncbi:hypothetical protein HPB51_027256 [Rhipicephalus microplus]|uniref:DUF676 domain-containing protein n=1 Tax=Rhipicephalus microplus TaxID=6941 RepID=A0A9J6D0M5_RHIMP|nr:hypothetical protein HPB51_027256 [Rhipicephalus microplus]
MCYLMLNALGNIHNAALDMFQVLHPLDDVNVFDKISAKDTFMKIQSVSQVVSSERAFVEFARGTVATLCCLNALLWEAFLRLVVGRTRAKRFLCTEYYRKKAEHFQELYFSCEKNRCSCVLTSKDCLTGSYRPLSKAIREFQFPTMIPPLEVFCPEVDECPTRPVIIFEEQYDCFSDICPLCGISNHDAGSKAHVGGQSSVAHGTSVANAVVHTPHRMMDNVKSLQYCTPMLFTDSMAEDAEAAPVRNKPVESDKSAHKRPEPEFVGLADRTLVFRQLQGSCESIGAIYRSSEPIHFVVFVNGLGGKSSDFFWAKRWMKLLIGTPKHILIWSQANEQEQTFHEISVCGLRLAVEVASYLDNIGTTDFKLSFIGFSLGCVIVRAALTCPQMRPYVKNLHTFFSINGPHLGVAYVKNRFLRFQISVLSKIRMKSSLKELTLQDSPDLRRCYLYILSQAPEDFCAQIANQATRPDSPLRGDVPGSRDYHMDLPFTVEELEVALALCRRSTSPGSDGIPYRALCKLGDGARRELLSLYNISWQDGNVPDDWKQEQTFHEISVCGLRLAVEVASYLDNIGTTDFKLSFIGFSLGCVIVRAALTCPQMRPYVKNLHTFFSINGPHLGVAYVKNRFLRFRLEYFKNVFLVGSSQDKLVPVNSSNIQHCPASVADKTVVGKTYDEMVKNLLGPLLKREDVNLRRFDVFYDTGRLRYLEPVFPSLSHVCALMSRNLFEKFMLLSAAECFK